jgi:SAM-dependent methyltransferase
VGPTYAEAVNKHYGPTDICARIIERLQQAGRDIGNLSREDLAPFDEFHGGGRESTRELAQFARLRPGLDVLDVGSGIGGPARTLAAEFGCQVIGMDLTEEFCRAAEMLTDMVGLGGKVRFRCANALEMPFADASFDVVWSQNTLMNIEDKAPLFREIRRVLRPGGMFAFETVLAGTVPGIHFPVFWADSSALSFLVTPAALKGLLSSAGMGETGWDDTTARSIVNQKKRKAAMQRDGPPVLGLGVIVPKDVLAKMDNVLRNNEEARTVTVQAVYAAGESAA